MIKPKFIALSVVGALILLGVAYYFYKHQNVPKIIIDDGNGPCPLADTVDLTGSVKFSNGSYLYEGLIIPQNLTQSYEYKPDDHSKWIPAKPHDRGCVCMLRPCVKFCCPLNKTSLDGNCVDLDGSRPISNTMNITSSRGEIRTGDMTKEFSIQHGHTCPHMFFLEIESFDTDNFTLFENGTLHFHHTKTYNSKEQFCLSYFEETYELTPMNCTFFDTISETRADVSAIIMLLSVPFFILTIIVYMAIPELRTLHGKALCCYLSGLTFGYSILSAIILTGPYAFTNIPCKILGFFGYFSFMFSFCWLSVISFDLYYKIRGIRGKYNEKQRFIFYSIYACGFSFILLCLTFAADNSSFIPDNWKPSIHEGQRCWFNGNDGWTTMVYLYGPMLIIVAFCLVMFVLTSRLIFGIQNEMSQMTNRKDSQKNLRSDRDKFRIFLRLFIIMGVTWSIEIIPYLMGTGNSWIALQYIIDFVNSIQGLLIFVMFVFKKKVKEQIIKRFLSNSSPEPNSQDSNKTTASSNNITLNDIAVYKPAADKLIPVQK